MTLERFLRLVRGGEKATVDLKLVCNAFNRTAGDQDKARAELVKDICAMANNGADTSYLIIGVGDDGKTVCSVTDPNLKSDNVQTLIRDAIHPRPHVRVHRLRWDTAPKPFTGVEFCVIQIGPNARHAYRLSKDYIEWSKKIHFRKNEVWVRNEATSDLATAEQILGLLRKGSRHEGEPEPSFENTRYDKLPTTDQYSEMAKDAAEVLSMRGVQILPASDLRTPLGQSQTPNWMSSKLREAAVAVPGFRFAVKIRGRRFIFSCRFERAMRKGGAQSRAIAADWRLEHGLCSILLENFTPSARFSRVIIDRKEPWGRFHVLAPRDVGWVKADLPERLGRSRIVLLTLPRISDKQTLRHSLLSWLKCTQDDDLLFAQMDDARRSLDDELRLWIGKSARTMVGLFHSTSPRKQPESWQMDRTSKFRSWVTDIAKARKEFSKRRRVRPDE